MTRAQKTVAVRKAKRKRLIIGYLRILFLITSIVVSSAITYSICYYKADGYRVIEVIDVHVQEHDSLWSIASKYDSCNMSIREYIEFIKEFNHLENSTIYVGKEIQVPIIERYNPIHG